MKQRSEAQAEELLFLRRWIANPLKVGALLPSSPFLANLIARQVQHGRPAVLGRSPLGPDRSDRGTRRVESRSR